MYCIQILMKYGHKEKKSFPACSPFYIFRVGRSVNLELGIPQQKNFQKAALERRLHCMDKNMSNGFLDLTIPLSLSLPLAECALQRYITNDKAQRALLQCGFYL